jgi:hypothetical protein
MFVPGLRRGRSKEFGGGWPRKIETLTKVTTKFGYLSILLDGFHPFADDGKPEQMCQLDDLRDDGTAGFILPKVRDLALV